MPGKSKCLEKPMLRKTVVAVVAAAAVAGGLLGEAGAAFAAPAAGAGGILDSGVNFSEPDGSQGINGNPGDCVPINLSETGSFQFVSGTMTLWTGANCNSGQATVINSDVANLPAIGFGQTESIFIGDNAPKVAPVPGASAILDSGTNFSEPDGSEGVGGNVGDVVNVNLSETGSIQFVSGTLTLFTGPNATGKSVVINSDVADLTALGFGRTQSILVGAAG
jgi:hypothetical protein